MAITGAIIGSIIGSESGGSTDAQAIRSIVTQATTDPTAGTANSITVGASHNAVCVWIGDRDPSEHYVNLYVNNGTRTRRYKLFRNQRVNIACAAGATLSFGSTIRTSQAFVGQPSSIVIKACPYVRPSSLVAASGASGTVNCDQNGPPFWSPSASHVTLASRNSRIQINSTAARQDVFMCEIDPDGNVSPVQHIIVPPNIDQNVEVCHTRLAFATFDGSTISIDAPTGATIGGTSVVYRPSYTATNPVAVDDITEFGAALAAADDGDDIILSSGTYTLVTAVNPSNYAAAMGKSIRIRSATGSSADVTINGASWYINLSDGCRWVIEGCTFDFNGLAMQSGATGLFCVSGGANASVHLHNCDVNGPSSTAGDTVFAANGKEGGHAHHYASLCNFSGPSTSGDLTSISSSTLSPNAKLTLFACSLSGNGNAGGNQIITTHSNQRYDVYHCVFSDAGATGNVTRVAAEYYSSPIYLMWCKSLAANIANADGVTVDLCAGIFSCDFTKVSVCQAPGGYIVASTVNEVRSAVMRQFFKWENPIGLQSAHVYGLSAANTFTTGTTSGDHGLDGRMNIESFGNEYFGSSTNSIALRLNTGTPPLACVVECVNDRFRTTSASDGINLGTSANLSLRLTNCIIDGYSGVGMTIGASGAACDSTNGYYRRAAAPTNWTTRFASTSGDTFSTTAAAVDGTTGIPTASGNCDGTGADPGYYGGMDRHGRALWLGGTFPIGPVELQSIKASPVLIPAVW